MDYDNTVSSMKIFLFLIRLSEDSGIDVDTCTDVITSLVSTLGITTDELLRFFDSCNKED